jgi:hypothetical protein
MILYGTILACLVAAGVVVQYKSDVFQTLPKAVDPRPTLWFVLDDQANSRRWISFEDRNARSSNRGYPEVALQAAFKTQGAFRIEVLEGRKAVMRANVSVGYLEPLLPYLARLVKVSRMDKPQASGDWHDKPLRWIVTGPDSEVQKFATKKDALVAHFHYLPPN